MTSNLQHHLTLIELFITSRSRGRSAWGNFRARCCVPRNRLLTSQRTRRRSGTRSGRTSQMRGCPSLTGSRPRCSSKRTRRYSASATGLRRVPCRSAAHDDSAGPGRGGAVVLKRPLRVQSERQRRRQNFRRVDIRHELHDRGNLGRRPGARHPLRVRGERRWVEIQHCREPISRAGKDWWRCASAPRCRVACEFRISGAGGTEVAAEREGRAGRDGRDAEKGKKGS